MGRQAGGLVGRESERAFLRLVLDEDGPLVMFVHGIGGVGKSTLLNALVHEARAAGAAVVALDGGTIEPTSRGFLDAVSTATAHPSACLEEVVEGLGALGPRVILALDGYEAMRLLDPWLRQTFVPALVDHVRVVIASRDRPVPGWSMGMGRLFRSLPLDNLPPADAERLLARDGVTGDDAIRINRLARGHPLSLRLAAAALTSGPGLDSDATSAAVIVRELTELYLARLDPVTRQVLDAASVVRRPTLSLLRAMLPDVAPQEAHDRLQGLPFVELGNDGLVLHETVREVVAGYLRSSDPDRSRRYRIAAWRQLRDEGSRAAWAELPRYTADLLYIAENPNLREAWFPSTEQRYGVDAARASDLPAILEIARRQFPDESIAVVEAWWEMAPSALRVARNGRDEVVGFCGVSDPERLPRRLCDADPVARRWRDHLRERPLGTGERAVGHHFERADPLDPSQALVHAALGLEVSRTWMALRPHLRRHYTVVRDLSELEHPVLRGAELLPGPPLVIDGTRRYPALIDFGPASVDGWLTALIATELHVEEDCMLDVGQRQLVVDGRRVHLTRLELGVFRALFERPGRVVERADLLREVWGYHDEGGSNVIEAVVRSLRRKLDHRADMIETVRGVGYRFVAPR